MMEFLLDFIFPFLDGFDRILTASSVGNTVHLANESRLIGLPIHDARDFGKLFQRFLFNLLITGIIAGAIYYPSARRRDYLFTYMMISITVFFLCFLLENVKLELGFALGLFAIFGIIRYRTDPIPIKEMTYLFVIIGVSVVNALVNKKISFTELLLTNVAIIVATVALEYLNLLRHELRKNIVYERIDLIKPEKRAELAQDLETRTGIKISRIEIGRIDFLRDVANIRIYYYEKDQAIPVSGYEETRSES